MSQLNYHYYENEHPAVVLPQLKRFVSRRARHKQCRFFYIGQTNNPQRRLNEHQREMTKNKCTKWTHMEVIYGHRSAGFVINVEDALITHGNSINSLHHNDNFLNIRGPSQKLTTDFFVYVLIDENNEINSKSSIDLDSYNSSDARATQTRSHLMIF